MSFSDPKDALQSLQQNLGSIPTRAFNDSTKRSMRTYLHSHLLFCQYWKFTPFPVSKTKYLCYLVFFSPSLSLYRSVVNYLGIITHINGSFGASLAFLQDYDVYLAKRALCRIMGDCVAQKEPITIEILLTLFSQFDFNNHLHVCMCALFLVAFFLFLRISNLVPHKLSDIADPQACHLTPSKGTFASQGAFLCITHTKTIPFHEQQLEICLPCIPGSPLCPVTALQQYLASVQLPPHSPLFVCKSRDAGLSWLTSIMHLLRHRSWPLASIRRTIPCTAFAEVAQPLISVMMHLQHLLKHKATGRMMLTYFTSLCPPQIKSSIQSQADFHPPFNLFPLGLGLSGAKVLAQ